MLFTPVFPFPLLKRIFMPNLPISKCAMQYENTRLFKFLRLSIFLFAFGFSLGFRTIAQFYAACFETSVK